MLKAHLKRAAVAATFLVSQTLAFFAPISGLAQKAYAAEIVNGVEIGVENGVYQIGSADQLKAFATGVNNRTISLPANAVLTSNIDMQNTDDFPMIGNNSNKYSGTFDGGGYKISNLRIDKENTDYVGFISRANDVTIKNLTFNNLTTKGRNNVGGLVGHGSGDVTISNCSNSGSVNGGNDTGGLVGGSSGSAVTITNSSNSGTVKAGSDMNEHIGGLYGGSNNKQTVRVENSVNSGSVHEEDKLITTQGNEDGPLCGLINKDSSSITNSYYYDGSQYKKQEIDTDGDTVSDVGSAEAVVTELNEYRVSQSKTAEWAPWELQEATINNAQRNIPALNLETTIDKLKLSVKWKAPNIADKEGVQGVLAEIGEDIFLNELGFQLYKGSEQLNTDNYTMTRQEDWINNRWNYEITMKDARWFADEVPKYSLKIKDVEDGLIINKNNKNYKIDKSANY